jgi:RimJ/RimL family protein N-acetyltransferase
LKNRQQPFLIVDNRFVLRPWTHDDFEALAAAYTDPDIQHWNLNSFDETEAKDLIVKWNDAWKSETGAFWAIARTSDDFAIGQVGLRNIDLIGGELDFRSFEVPGLPLTVDRLAGSGPVGLG